MAAYFVSLICFLAIVGHSKAGYCICKDGVSESQLQKTIDYACASGADCTSITQSGACYNPNTVKDHCNWAVNSYYQKKGQAALSCDFSGTAAVTASNPSQSSSCVYPTGSGGSVGTPTTGTPSTGTPTSGRPTTGTPTSGNGTGSGMGTTTSPITTTPGTTPGSYGLAPSGSGGLDSTASQAPSLHSITNFAITISLACFSLIYV